MSTSSSSLNFEQRSYPAAPAVLAWATHCSVYERASPTLQSFGKAITPYFIHPITDGVPRLDPEVLKAVTDLSEARHRLERYRSHPRH